MKPLADTLAPACTPLHVSALLRVDKRRSMFGAPARDASALWDNAETARDLREWRLVAGAGDGLYVTNLGRAVLHKLRVGTCGKCGKPVDLCRGDCGY